VECEIVKQRGTGERKEYLVRIRGKDGSVAESWKEKDDVDRGSLAEYHRRFTARGEPRKRIRKHVQEDDPEWYGE